MQIRAPTDVQRLLKHGVAELINEAELSNMLMGSALSGKPLRLKQGFDPSRPDIHLGHVVGLRKLRQFQELGHQVILIVGDWTAQIGDPSGELTTRPMLTLEEVRANAQTYMEQFFQVVNRDKTQVRWQSEWYSQFGLDQVLRLTSRFTIAQLLARDDFNARYASGRPISLTELLYPLLQAYDSVVIQADVEFGGIDQKFNCLVGRELQTMMGQKPQQILLMPLLLGRDGKQKMSKSLDNYIGIAEIPDEIYGKIMSIPDHLILSYFELITDVTDAELEGIRHALEERTVNPMHLKKRLAGEVVSQFHGKEAAQQSQARFETIFQRHETPQDIPEYTLTLPRGNNKVLHLDLPQVLFTLHLVKSRGEAKRLIAQGALRIDGQVVTSNIFKTPPDATITINLGKRRFSRLKLLIQKT